MIGTNQELSELRKALDRAIKERWSRACETRTPLCSDRELLSLYRGRRAITTALERREIEAAKPFVTLSRWVSGNGALTPNLLADIGVASNQTSARSDAQIRERETQL